MIRCTEVDSKEQEEQQQEVDSKVPASANDALMKNGELHALILHGGVVQADPGSTSYRSFHKHIVVLL